MLKNKAVLSEVNSEGNKSKQNSWIAVGKGDLLSS